MNLCHSSFLTGKTKYQKGFTLIELMIALLLGILVVIAVSSVFISGKQSHSTTQGLNRIQENQRMAFDLISSDIRSAGSYVCPSLADPVWQVGTIGSDWPETRFMLAVGLEGNSPLFPKDKNAKPEFDSILLSIDSAASALAASSEEQYYPIQSHKTPSSALTLAAGQADHFKRNSSVNYMAACNIDVAIVFGTNTLSGDTIKADNLCGTGFSRNPPADCTDSAGKGYCFWGKLSDKITEEQKQDCGEWSSSQAFVVNLMDYNPVESQFVNAWYVDNKDGKGKLINPARGGIIVEGVTGLELRYRLRDSGEYLTADEVRTRSPTFNFTRRKGVGTGNMPTIANTYASDWSKVDSVYLKMTFKSPDEVVKGTDGNVLQRTMETYIAVRSHMLEY